MRETVKTHGESAGRFRGRGLLRTSVVALSVAAMLGSLAGPALAASQRIVSAGPINLIDIEDDLTINDVQYMGVSQTLDSNGGTGIYVDGNYYSGGFADDNLVPVSQSVTGTGTGADPFEIVTVVEAGETGVELTQTDSYVTGEDSYRTDVEISSSGDRTREIVLYKIIDCNVENNDSGFGREYPATGSAACIEAVDNPNEDQEDTPGDGLIGLRPLSGSSNYVEGNINDVESPADVGATYQNTVTEEFVSDNRLGLSFERTVPADGSVTVSHLTTFSEDDLTRDTNPEPDPDPDPQPNPNACTITGTSGNDNLRGTPGRDVICGLGGNDVLRGLGGNDVLRGGTGNDAIYGGDGADRIEGQDGKDALYGERGNDTILGGAGNDVLRGGPGDDTLNGGSGRNSVRQ